MICVTIPNLLNFYGAFLGRRYSDMDELFPDHCHYLSSVGSFKTTTGQDKRAYPPHYCIDHSGNIRPSGPKCTKLSD